VAITHQIKSSSIITPTKENIMFHLDTIIAMQEDLSVLIRREIKVWKAHMEETGCDHHGRIGGLEQALAIVENFDRPSETPLEL
jgi:ribosomal protein S15P/S13E